MNTKKKGDRGLGKALEYFTSKGYSVSIPLTDSQDYDLVIDYGEGLKSVQVKYTSYIPKGKKYYNCDTKLKGGTKGSIWKRFEDMSFDFVFVQTENGICYFIPRDKIPPCGSINLAKRYIDHII